MPLHDIPTHGHGIAVVFADDDRKQARYDEVTILENGWVECIFREDHGAERFYYPPHAIEHISPHR